MRLLAPVVVVAAVAVALHGRLSEGAGMCPHDKEACFFSDGYTSARLRFRAAAARLNATLEQLVVSEGADLTIDVAVLPADSSDADPPTLVHFSGTHGVEAYAGSAVQLALLQQWAAEPSMAPARRGVRVVLVHAVNPYGFACGRRFNEDSVDLNRNVLSEREFAELSKTGTERQHLYDSYQWLFNHGRAWNAGDDLLFVAKALYGIVVLGTVNVKRAVVAGQYHMPDGLYFGGRELATSHRLLVPHLQRVAAPSKAAILIDVHTGLGPTGVDTLIPAFEQPDDDAGDVSPQANADAIRQIFAASGADSASGAVLGVDFLIDAPTPSEASAEAASAGYEVRQLASPL